MVLIAVSLADNVVTCSALVGIGLTVALLPVPGWLATVASRVQDEKMKKVRGAQFQLVLELSFI